MTIKLTTFPNFAKLDIFLSYPIVLRSTELFGNIPSNESQFVCERACDVNIMELNLHDGLQHALHTEKTLYS